MSAIAVAVAAVGVAGAVASAEAQKSAAGKAAKAAKEALYLLKWCMYVLEGAMDGHHRAISEFESGAKSAESKGKG